MGKIELRDFDGDLTTALPAMAYDTLFEEHGQDTWLDLNRPEIARHLFADVPDPRFLIGAYDGTRLVAFIANLPRTWCFNGQTYRGVASTMMAVHKDYRGAVVYLISECLRRNEQFGADLALIILEKRNRSWRLFEQALKPRYRIERLKPMHAIVHGVDMEKIVESQHLKWYEIDFLYWEGLDAKEQQGLLAGLWQASREQGCIGIMEWNKNYYAKGALYRSHFIPYPHFIEVNAWILNPALSLQGIERIFEQVV